MRLSDGPEHLRPIREFGLEQARRHRDIVARFGRHPHRNETLGRNSTPEEAAYVATGEFVHHRRPPQHAVANGSDHEPPPAPMVHLPARSAARR